ncbi:DUF2254 domain-containing protein [soil metagenome]
MKAEILKHWEELRSSYWFVPSLMTLAAIALSVTAVAVDRQFSIDASGRFAWLYINRPDGARALLATIAGSAITVGGVVFSITIAAVAYTTSQFGPRLLSNFMRDRGNQVTLGTFIATFLYCLLILRFVRSAGEVMDDESALAQSFVPHVAVLVALFLALASVAVLIYYLHHLTRSIHISNVIAEVGEELLEALDKRFPDKDQHPAAADPDPDELAATLGEEPLEIRARQHGYCQNFDENALLDIASRNHVILLVDTRPGHFVHDASVLGHAWPRDGLAEDDQADIRRSFAFGARRTVTQDVMFPVSELTEIAIRALSPGLNDPYTAMNCMNWLNAALVRMADRAPRPHTMRDDDGALRVILPRVTFEFMVHSVWDRLRPYVSRDPIAARHMMRLLGELAPSVSDGRLRLVLREHADALLAASRASLTDDRDLELLTDRHRRTLAALEGGHSEAVELIAETDAETEL